GSANTATKAASGVSGRGAGGGGTGNPNTLTSEGGNGGSGVVIVRYATANVQCAPERVNDGAYVVVAFKDVGNCTWSAPAGVSTVDYLVVAGGGGGGSDHGGGGGAGGRLTGTTNVATSMSISVGAGGAGGASLMTQSGEPGSNGTNSSLVSGNSTVTAGGGGGGGSGGSSSGTWTGLNGGSGGGSAAGSSTGGATSGQGNSGGLSRGGNCESSTNSGYCGGGGGGAGAVGGAALDATPDIGGAGGIGYKATSLLSVTAAQILGVGEVSSSSVYFAGGGGGGAMSNARGGPGGLGGGGAGDNVSTRFGFDGLTNTGGGGGGGGRSTSGTALVSAGGDGGSGVVVLRYLSSPIDYALSLNGTSQAGVTVDTTTLGKFSSYTVEAWFELSSSRTCTSSVRCTIVGRDGDYELFTSDGTLKWVAYYGGSTPGIIDTGVPVTVGSWNHVAMVRSGTAITIYLNGQSVATGTLGGASASTLNYALRVGYIGYGSNYFPGKIDEVKIWNTARSASDIATGMHTNAATTDTNLVAYYDFNEGAGSTIFNRKSGAATDTNLTLSSSPTFADVKSTSVTQGSSVITFPRSYITSAGGWIVPQDSSTMDVLVVGGGGGGGSRHGGGGGGGGFAEVLGYQVTPGGTYAVTVGQGGKGADASTGGDVGGQTNGAASSFLIGSLGITGSGGERGTPGAAVGGSSGSSVGNGVAVTSYVFAGGARVTSPDPWRGGGGGGAGGVGSPGGATAAAGAGAGGPGRQSSISGSGYSG
ncbi:MAG: LamG domain-containing protein, partial [Ilumatobacteraceae bacterium]